MTTVADCYPCAQNARADRLPPRERIGLDDLWRVAHAFDTALPGWLVLLPRRHVTSVAELTDAEAAALGTWQVRLSRALREVVGCEKTYVAQFAEAEGFSHVHFHIVPRSPDLARELRGPRIFRLLGPADGEHVSEVAMDELAGRLAWQLRSAAPGLRLPRMTGRPACAGRELARRGTDIMTPTGTRSTSSPPAGRRPPRANRPGRLAGDATFRA